MESKSHRESSTENTTIVASNVSAGRDMTIVSTQGDINVAGSNLAASNVVLASARDVILQSAANTSQSKYKSHDTTVEVGAFASAGQDGVGGGAYADGNLTHNNRNSNGTGYSETTVSAADTLTIISARDVTLEGAQASGNRIIADVGRNLSLVSQQDTNHFKQKEETTSAGGSVTIVGAGPTEVHGSYGQSNINSDYKSVQEQTGLFAGNGGFDIYVGNHTNLVGAVIASTADATHNVLSTETFSYSNLQNKYETTSSNYGLSYQSGNLGGGEKPTPQQTTNGASKPQYATPSAGGLTPSIGVASEDKDNSTTYSAVSNGTFEIRSGGTSDVSRDTSNANHPLENKFDLTEIEEQQELARVFGEEGFRVAGDFAEYMGWKNGSLEKIMLHSVVGGMQAGLGGGNIFAGAAGAGVSEGLNGLTATWGDDARQWASFGIGAAFGAMTGSYQSGAATALTGEQNNRQLHEVEIDAIKKLAKEFAAQEGITESEAELRLSEQALRQTDAWYAFFNSGKDDEASAFLHANSESFYDSNRSKQMQMFESDASDYQNTWLYSETLELHPLFYAKPYKVNEVSSADSWFTGTLKSTANIPTAVGNIAMGLSEWAYNGLSGDNANFGRFGNLVDYSTPQEMVAGTLGGYATAIASAGVGIAKEVVIISRAKTAATLAKESAQLAKEMNILRVASKEKGNFGLGTGTREEADRLGKIWVGEGYKTASDGEILISADGLRQYRPSSFKPNSPYGKVQANFERRLKPEGKWFGNGHLDIKD